MTTYTIVGIQMYDYDLFSHVFKTNAEIREKFLNDAKRTEEQILQYIDTEEDNDEISEKIQETLSNLDEKMLKVGGENKEENKEEDRADTETKVFIKKVPHDDGEGYIIGVLLGIRGEIPYEHIMFQDINVFEEDIYNYIEKLKDARHKMVQLLHCFTHSGGVSHKNDDVKLYNVDGSCRCCS